MAGQYTGTQKSYRIMDADGVALYKVVTLTGENECKKPVADNEIPLGTVINDSRQNIPFQDGGDQTGRQVAVCIEGISNLTLAGTVAVGDRLISAVGGNAKVASSLAAGTKANVIGFAEKSGVAGDVIPVRLAYHVYTV